ncbi:hypothetical protein chiPu_0015294 [Chiloscyllium punctatum]|uniref:Uncharacterized protein n=1 Tax=Chiloscyllium punctatum TaxID=137246 RepID=A0A401T2B2_CHIPU|nr:hypothetical protein [Chiloscyllium punctatum]
MRKRNSGKKIRSRPLRGGRFCAGVIDGGRHLHARARARGIVANESCGVQGAHFIFGGPADAYPEVGQMAPFIAVPFKKSWRKKIKGIGGVKLKAILFFLYSGFFGAALSPPAFFSEDRRWGPSQC